MAKYETEIYGNFDEFLHEMEEAVEKGRVTAKLEERSDFCEGNARCSVRVFERYSLIGGNRLSLSVTLFQAEGGPIHISAAATGGSQAMFLKINTIGEENFLEKFISFMEGR